MNVYNNQLHNCDFSIESHRQHRKNGKVIKYSNDILTFDIEVTSAFLEGGKVIGYRKGEEAEYWNSLQPLALPYIWQFSFNGEVYYGRELRDFLKVLSDLPSDVEFIIWVHNLAYEFQFLCNLFEWKSIFARSPHKVMKCKPKEYPNIEFRCTYMLTRLSLDSWGKQLGVYKATGDLDYEVLRTPLTALTDEELYYCEQDCKVVDAGVRYYLNKYKNLRDIPLTQTGTVRLEVKNRLMSDRNYAKRIKKLIPRDCEEYRLLQKIFSGGYTHANRLYSGYSIKDYIEHYDFASSYPTVMLAEKYPMTPWIYLCDKTIREDRFDDYAYIFELRFSQLKSISYNTYIQSSCVSGSNLIYDNGRVISADTLTMTMTEQDYITIKNNYIWDNLEVLSVYRSRKEYLPKPLIEFILELYRNKTELKDIPEYEDLYMQSKQYINALFGMCVTAIIQADVEYENDEWNIKKLSVDEVTSKLNKLRNYSPREKRYFLSYSWGCWVTAYARRNLWKCIEKYDDKVLYVDTDSAFILGKANFDWYNEEITSKIRKVCDELDLDFSKTSPKTIKGKEKPLGVFAKEEPCSEFITLGAKRYVERRMSDNKLHLTVSGINKDAVELLNDDIDNFVNGFDFDKDADCVNKRLATYLYDMPTSVWNDGYVSTYKYGINLRRTGYKLTMTDEYMQLIEYVNTRITINDLPVGFVNAQRGRFLVD